MSAPRVRADYDQLARIAAAFDRQSSETQRLLKDITQKAQTLENGDWVGRGADAFYREMDSQVLPSLKRLASALDEAIEPPCRSARSGSRPRTTPLVSS